MKRHQTFGGVGLELPQGVRTDPDEASEVALGDQVLAKEPDRLAGPHPGQQTDLQRQIDNLIPGFEQCTHLVVGWDRVCQASIYSEVSLPTFNIWEAAIILVICLPLGAFLGFWLGRRKRKSLLLDGGAIGQVGMDTTIAAVLALLGLLLAFSFGNALSLAEARKSAIVNEANALGTAFLRMEYLPDDDRKVLQNALYQYSKSRLVHETGALDSDEDLQSFLDNSLQIQATLWPLTVEAMADPLPAPVGTFVTGAVNEVLDAHQVRMKNFSSPVTELAQIMVFSTALMSLFLLGNHSGIEGQNLTWRTFVLSALLWIVMMTIIDLQRPFQGFIRTDQIPLKATILDMEQRLKTE